MSALAKALTAAQSEFPSIERTKDVRVTTKTGGSYTFAYAPLDAIVGKVQPVLAKHGLAFTQLLDNVDGSPALRTRLLHEDGESLGAVCPLPANGSASAQEFGSLVTYMRRYALVALLGIATEEDDDGNAASGNRVSKSAGEAKPVSEPTHSPAEPSAPGVNPSPTSSGDAAGTATPAESGAENPAETARQAQEQAKAARAPGDDGKPENVIVNFGKHKGEPLGQVPQGYLEWIVGNYEPKTAEQRRIVAAASVLIGAEQPALVGSDDDIPFAPVPV